MWSKCVAKARITEDRVLAELKSCRVAAQADNWVFASGQFGLCDSGLHRTERDAFGSSSLCYFSERIQGVNVIPINNPSGPRRRVTVWPHGSFLALISVR